eukprot:1659452-Prymnesium_polylepis.1
MSFQDTHVIRLCAPLLVRGVWPLAVGCVTREGVGARDVPLRVSCPLSAWRASLFRLLTM